jgi:predicted DsbA family dithiol-disulfide isomerase
MLLVDVVSDVICPWCFIGTRHLNRALESLPGPVETKVVFHPFLLDPDTPPEGADLRQRLRAKYGRDPEQMFATVEAAARSAGISLDFAKVRLTPSTVPAHTLLRHARERGTQRALAEALFVAYFLEGKDLGDAVVLSRIAALHGFDAREAALLVADGTELDKTRASAKEMARRGITGVPYFVFGGSVGVAGAQPPEVLREAMAKAIDAQTPIGEYRA